MSCFERWPLVSLLRNLLLMLIGTTFLPAFGQKAGGLHGAVLDPSGAAIPGAQVKLSGDGRISMVQSGADGLYVFHSLAPGRYTITVEAKDFALPATESVGISSGESSLRNLSLVVAAEQQNIQVSSENAGVSVNPEENAGALVLKGDDLDALSDDPDELQNELQALAGPAAGPAGGQVYIDGFTGGQLPPKSSIREIRVNQNPFSAEFDKVGYGRIEILTKPGSNKFGGHLTAYGTDSAWNTGNPLIQRQPDYYLSLLQGDVNGPLTKHSSYFLSAGQLDQQNQNIMFATDPADGTGTIQEASPSPRSYLSINPRIDLQAGEKNTLSVRNAFTRSVQTGNGVGGLNLASQAYRTELYENALQVSDSILVNSHWMIDVHFQWRHIRNQQIANFFTPTITVQGSFTDGGNNSGVVRDHQDIFELQNYSMVSAGRHVLRFGVRVRAYRDANESTSGANGNYIFSTYARYQAGTPDQYQANIIETPLARVLLFDAAAFYQDDWHARPNLIVSYGLRYEVQNRIHDYTDFAPRLALAWVPGKIGKLQPKTVIRVGYGWFYDRFTVPNSFNSGTGTPYMIQAIHQDGVHQQSYVVNQPSFFDPSAPIQASMLQMEASSRPTIFSVDPHLHAALNMQAGVGIDRQFGKHLTGNMTYLYTRGIHQYFTNVVTAPDFDESTYTLTSPTPAVYNNQFQSGGYFAQHQILLTTTVRFGKLSLHGNYSFGDAKSDTQGVNSTPSVAQKPGLDYGRASFGIHHRLLLIGTYSVPHGITLASLLVAQSGMPYNLTIGDDLTGNNQFNARPTYGVCGASDVVSTPYGCLDANPIGKRESLVPYGLGTGPANVSMHLRLSKAIGIGPHVRGATGTGGSSGGGGMEGRGLSSNQSRPKLDATVPRRYSLTLVAGAMNVFNIVNRAPENGVLKSRLFGVSQSLAGGEFGLPVSGNRIVTAQAVFSF